MPFLALAGPIAGMLGASAATAATIGTVAGAAGTAYSAYKGAQGANQAQKLAGQAGQSAQVDVNQLNEITRQIAKQNALDSAELERQLTPEVPQLRTAANQGILRGLNDTSMQGATNYLQSTFANQSALNTPLLQAAIAKARENLALGGQLDTQTQNAVTRQGLSTAGTVAPGQLGLGRDVVARDLGLSSLALGQQRLADATQLGGMENQQQQFQTSFDASNVLNKIQLLKSLSDGNFARQLGAAQYGESIRQPIIGLDPASVANLAVGNQNVRSAALSNQSEIAGQGANNWLNLTGQGLGYFMNNMMKTGTPSQPSSINNASIYANSWYK